MGLNFLCSACVEGRHGACEAEWCTCEDSDHPARSAIEGSAVFSGMEVGSMTGSHSICKACLEGRHYACGAKWCNCTHAKHPAMPSIKSFSTKANVHPGSPKLKEGKLGVGTGIAMGSVFGALLIIGGAILCMTVVGAIVGIPMIIAGIGLPLGELLSAGDKTLAGHCPYCETPHTIMKRVRGFTCRVCKKRLLVRGDGFVLVED